MWWLVIWVVWLFPRVLKSWLVYTLSWILMKCFALFIRLWYVLYFVFLSSCDLFIFTEGVVTNMVVFTVESVIGSLLIHISKIRIVWWFRIMLHNYDGVCKWWYIELYTSIDMRILTFTQSIQSGPGVWIIKGAVIINKMYVIKERVWDKTDNHTCYVYLLLAITMHSIRLREKYFMCEVLGVY